MEGLLTWGPPYFLYIYPWCFIANGVRIYKSYFGLWLLLNESWRIFYARLLIQWWSLRSNLNIAFRSHQYPIRLGILIRRRNICYFLMINLNFICDFRDHTCEVLQFLATILSIWNVDLFIFINWVTWCIMSSSCMNPFIHI